MKLARAVATVSVFGMLGVLILSLGKVSAVINDEINFLGQEFQFAVSPVVTEFELIPGKTTGDTYRVRNVGSEEINLKISIAPLTFSERTTLLGVPREEILDWTTITLSKCTPTKAEKDVIYVHMRVKEECFVKFSTKTPAEAPFGEQYMGLYFQEYREDDGEGMQMVRSISAGIFGTNRTGSSDGDLCSEVADQKIPFWIFKGPLDTTANVKNCGRLNFHTKATLEVHNLFGGLVYKDNEPVDYIVVAESVRAMTYSWNEASIGLYKVKQTIEVLGKSYEVEKWTFIIPIWLIVVILACILVIVASITYDRKKKRMKRAGGK